MAGFLIPYFVVLFSVRWLYFEYRYSGSRGVAMEHFRRWRRGDALRLVLLFGSWINMHTSSDIVTLGLRLTLNLFIFKLKSW